MNLPDLPPALPGRARPRRAGRPQGFTLIEMLVVMTLIALLLTLALPRYFHSLDYGRANVQRLNVSTIRDAIDKFYGDLGRYPDTLEELVSKRYLRQLPVDPVSETANWVTVPPLDPTLGNVYDILAPKAEPTEEPRP